VEVKPVINQGVRLVRAVTFIFVAAVSACVSADSSAPAGLSSPTITVNGLLPNTVILDINGVQRVIKAGQESPEGVKLIRADGKMAVVEIDGKQQTLTLSSRVGGTPYQEAQKSEVRIPRGVGGHYFTPGRINNRPVSFLVDTGATSIALNSRVAERLGIDYRSGQRVMVQTASGNVQAYQVVLYSVAVGDVVVNNVRAVVNEGAFPVDILLGNTYLSRVGFKIDQGVLVLQANY